VSKILIINGAKRFPPSNGSLNHKFARVAAEHLVGLGHSVSTIVVDDGYASARSINIARAGGSYVLGSFTLGGYYSFSQYNPDAGSAFRKSEKYHNAEVYATWQIAPSLQTQIGYDYMKSYGDSSAKQHQVSIGADYFLSKRTDLYGIAAYAHASGHNGTGPAQAVIVSVDVDSGANSQALVVVGIRHKF
jgi:predicted porin